MKLNIPTGLKEFLSYCGALLKEVHMDASMDAVVHFYHNISTLYTDGNAISKGCGEEDQEELADGAKVDCVVGNLPQQRGNRRVLREITRYTFGCTQLRGQ